jgi:hypothetical protein
MTVTSGWPPKRLAVETLWGLRSVQTPGRRALIAAAFVVCSMVSSVCWASSSSFSSWFVMFIVCSRCWGPSIGAHAISSTLWSTAGASASVAALVARCHQHVVNVVCPVRPGFYY